MSKRQRLRTTRTTREARLTALQRVQKKRLRAESFNTLSGTEIEIQWLRARGEMSRTAEIDQDRLNELVELNRRDTDKTILTGTCETMGPFIGSHEVVAIGGVVGPGIEIVVGTPDHSERLAFSEIWAFRLFASLGAYLGVIPGGPDLKPDRANPES